ncbi:expressed unknown protein [Seminavis robusta]|uniref:Uncharacterized protein n=1 Tax=Seminavis robusta TaxID=568900 RepID=A0A9N8DW44_9STRA|nr:expressed unknown protein [Seminavis robusta]|eukprot:Sro388_g132370.1 n/a (461) ;mRNA; f:41748-43130
MSARSAGNPPRKETSSSDAAEEAVSLMVPTHLSYSQPRISFQTPTTTSHGLVLLLGAILAALALFLAGFLAGIYYSSSPYPANFLCEYYHHLNRSNESNDESAAVSYKFLDTHRGQEIFQELATELNHEGPAAMLATLTTRMANDSQLESSCHPLVHRLGRDYISSHYPTSNSISNSQDDGSILEQCLDHLLDQPGAPLIRTCNAAYLHGVIEHYYLLEQKQQKQKQPNNNVTETEQLLLQLTRDVNDQVCQQLFVNPNSSALSNKWECHHGIGHGILQFTQQLHDKLALQQALQICLLAEDVDTTICHNGLFMEYWANMRRLTTFDDNNNNNHRIQQTCQGKSLACSIYAPTAYLLQHPRDYVGAIRVCQHGYEPAQQLQHQIMCYQGVGVQAAKENLDDFTPVEAACLAVPNKGLQAACMSKALTYYKDSFGVDFLPKELCEPLQAFQSLCQRMSNRS